MREALQRAWLHRGALAWLLLPLSLVFGLVAALRRATAAPQRVGVPVVVVGNVIAGGSGKTPVVQTVVRHLKARGLKVGVVSRGYGRRTSDCREVTAQSEAADVGDEPLLIARSCGVPVFVAAKRVEAAQALLRAHPGTQVIVSDDGLQHHALARDIEICVFDERGTGNGWLLPAGPLREPWPRRVDFVIGHGGLAVLRQLATEAVRADGSHTPLARLQDVTAVAGIAKPQAFFDMLTAAGVGVTRTIALPDHHDFAAPPDVRGTLVCTEKDAVKLWRTRPDAWAVPLQVELDPAFWTAFDAKLSSTLDGPQTA
ncbi:tetraacyldisaccharide 4'-kinase [Ramlibacter sp. PS4R-6]|uniref:tetraacyldisaccharide 4'-kinase n=1 Tax=Ramlibacter sp. PS4R-6 TaxID=3133438 RepID=UPI003097C5AD